MRTLYAILIAVSLCSLIACEQYLDVKPDKKLATPETLKDLQAVLDAATVNQNYPNASELGSDNLYYASTDWNSLSDIEARNAYIWDANTMYWRDWNSMYEKVFTANVILSKVDDAASAGLTEGQRDDIKGNALFLRGYALYHLTQVYTLPYQADKSTTLKGLPLPLKADVTQEVSRSSMKETFDRIVSDLKNAGKYLSSQPLFRTRASKPAAFAALARVYLSMQEYGKAGDYADSCLQLYGKLIDFNNLNASESYPLETLNDEVIYHSTLSGVPGIFDSPRAQVVPELYDKYAGSDLRKTVFFKSNPKGGFSFKGTYSGDFNLFNGLATNEVILIRAEAAIRKGLLKDGLDNLNLLLEKRFKTGTFIPHSPGIANGEALRIVLEERRKELAFRGGIRWSDVRRLNQEDHRQTLTRTLNGKIYSLAPGDRRFAFLIPENVIKLSGIEQNER